MLEAQNLLIALIASSTWMAAISWYVGLVHYPAFRYVQPDDWRKFHQSHTNWTGVLVALPMVVQIIATVGLVMTQAEAVAKVASVICLALSVGWTGAVSGPKHMLLKTKDDRLIDSLIRTNHIRSVAWTAQAILAMGWLLSLR